MPATEFSACPLPPFPLHFFLYLRIGSRVVFAGGRRLFVLAPWQHPEVVPRKKKTKKKHHCSGQSTTPLSLKGPSGHLFKEARGRISLCVRCCLYLLLVGTGFAPF